MNNEGRGWGIEMKSWVAASALCASVLSACFILSGCASSIYGWQVRTTSTPFSASGEPAIFQQEPVALLSAVTVAGLRGNEVALVYYLHEILRKVTPEWKVVSPQETVARINGAGLAAEYMRMRAGYEESNILDRDSLRRIGAAIGARYVFQLRLASFTQTMTERWKALDVRLTQTRWGDMRLVLQLWDANIGELVWVSAAETSMQGEGVSQDPVYLEDIARATLGGMMADFLNRKTASMYTPVNKFLDDLIKEAMPQEQNGK
ncbi:MAG: hypothetical protein P0119_08590 [Nitrospira sp.]|nr:hypothetical protein [Nitrospira sp.]